MSASRGGIRTGLHTPEDVEQYNKQLQESLSSLCNLHSQPGFENFKIRSRPANFGSQQELEQFNWPTAFVASIVLLPFCTSLTFAAFELYGASHIEIALSFALITCTALVAYVARGQILPQNFRPLLPRIGHELSSYAIAALVCFPLWVLAYLLLALILPGHLSLSLASFTATAWNLYLGGPFGDKRRRLTSSIASSARQKKAQYSSKRKEIKLASKQKSVEKFKVSYLAKKPEAICKFYKLFFAKSALAQLFEQSLNFAYFASDSELIIDADAPSIDIIPRHKGARYTKSSDTVRYVETSAQDRNGQYRQFLASWALRMAADALLADRVDAIDSVIFNAFSNLIDPATGKDQRICILSVRLHRADLDNMDIARVDQVACLRKLGARLSADLSGNDGRKVSISVQPLRTASGAKPSGVDQPLNLLTIDPLEFEHLLANLFERMGLTAELTKASHDGGIDIIAHDNRPILGGKIIIQAKRYKRTVPVSCVRDLYGVMQHEGASKAILVTTSKLGADAWQFVQGKAIQLIEGQELIALLDQQGIKAHL